MKPIYLDNAATTPLDPRVLNAMLPYLDQELGYGNASSLHFYGKKAASAIDEVREQIGSVINAEPQSVIFTSCATESINLALKGIAQLYQRKGKHIVTFQTEHKATLDTCQFLEKNGYQVTYLPVEKNGVVDLAHFAASLQSDTILVSVMHVNNETGIIQDLAKIAELTSARGIFLHVDAVQSVGKLSLDLRHLPIDLVSFSAHKIYGPKGIGALYIRKKPRIRVAPLIHGGGQQQGMRSGTLATHQIVGLGKAFLLAESEYQEENIRIRELSQHFLQGLKNIHQVILNTDLTCTVPHIINVRFFGMLADAILTELPGIAASTASACQGRGLEGSYVLKAMQFNDAEIKSSIRFSLGRFTTTLDIDAALKQLTLLFSRR